MARWPGVLLAALLVYVVAVSAWMLSRAGGDQLQHYLGLLADGPACLAGVVLAAVTARGLPRGPLRAAWQAITLALALYFVGTVVAVTSWLLDRDPFPGPADVFFLAFYPAFFAAVLFLVRAWNMRVPWAHLALDVVILVVGFGASFWFLAIRPAEAQAELDLLKHVLSQAYVALNCILVLAFGLLLLTGAEGGVERRVSLLLLAGCTTMFLGDIVWALAKVSGGYVPGDLQDVMYVAWYVPIGAAARHQLRAPVASPAKADAAPPSLALALPYVAVLVAFLVLVFVARDEVGGPVAVMTIVAFVLTLLVMVRQGTMLRDDARTRERRATEMVEARYASLIANASDVILIVGADGALRFASPAFERVFGLKPEAASGQNLLDLWRGDDAGRLRDFIAEVAAARRGAVGPIELRLEQGARWHTLEIVGSDLTADPAVQGLALNLRDISERKALEERLREQALRDPLTGLANRTLFRDRVAHAILLARRERRRVAAMFLDLDNFKTVNDTLGHDVGDRLLQAVATRLVHATRTTDTVARLAGDEFAVLLEGIDTMDDVQRPAEALVQALGTPFVIGDAEVRMSTSVGVALWAPDSATEELLSNADVAMYQAKAAGKDRYVVFEPRMQEAIRERLRLEADIVRALAHGELFLEYQPVVALDTRRLIGVEALLRWRHADRGVLMPGQFIQVAEESGHVIELGRWVLQRACADWQRWCRETGAPGLQLAVNVSARHLQQGDLVRDVDWALRESGLDPGSLVLELTESTIMHHTAANLERLHELKALGVRIAIDDFGMGYSSLAYLHRFPIDILKVDRSFVSRLVADGEGPELARAVVTLGRTLGLETVAEGIESDAQALALLALGCTAGQGFLFARPGSLDQVSAAWRLGPFRAAVGSPGAFSHVSAAVR
ncbi:MAG: EAL domain-containing protein [Acidobacteria bacterium]|nr:EAL domain-containing protein [Acidobacteriota bacterium]